MRPNAVRAPEVGTLHHSRTALEKDADARPENEGDVPGSTSRPRPLSVMQIVPALDGGAAAAGVVNLVRVLCQTDHRAVVVADGGRRVEDVRGLGGEFRRLNVSSINPLAILANGLQLARLVRQHGCDIVHAHGRAAAWSGYLAARICGRPFVTTWYKGFREQNVFKRFYNSVMVRGDRTIVMSDQIADLIRARYGPQPLAVIPWGIDLQYFDPAGVTPARIEAMRHRFGVGERTRLVLAPARILRRKGHHVVVRAVERLKALGVTDFACVFASEEAGTRYAGELWDQVLASRTADVIRLSGPVGDVPAAYAAATVVVSASMQADGLPRAVLEAQAMARPVIASDLGAGPEALLASPAVPEDRMTGIRVPAGDAEALAAALVKIFAMPEPARRAMGARGRRWIAANFDPQETAAKVLALYAAAALPADTPG